MANFKNFTHLTTTTILGLSVLATLAACGGGYDLNKNSLSPYSVHSAAELFDDLNATSTSKVSIEKYIPRPANRDFDDRYSAVDKKYRANSAINDANIKAKEKIGDDCVASPTCGHAIVFAEGYSFAKTNRFIYATPGKLIELKNGNAIFTGVLVDKTDVKKSLAVQILLKNKQNAAQFITTKADSTYDAGGKLNFALKKEAYKAAGGTADPTFWDTYEFESGTMTGLLDYDGITFKIDSFNRLFQIGVGANSHNIQFGASVWFAWEITSDTAKAAKAGWTLPNAGVGDVDVDLNVINDPTPSCGDDLADCDSDLTKIVVDLTIININITNNTYNTYNNTTNNTTNNNTTNNNTTNNNTTNNNTTNNTDNSKTYKPSYMNYYYQGGYVIPQPVYVYRPVPVYSPCGCGSSYYYGY